MRQFLGLSLSVTKVRRICSCMWKVIGMPMKVTQHSPTSVSSYCHVGGLLKSLRMMTE